MCRAPPLLSRSRNGFRKSINLFCGVEAQATLKKTSSFTSNPYDKPCNKPLYPRKRRRTVSLRMLCGPDWFTAVSALWSDWAIDPTSASKLTWDWLVIVLVLYNAIVVPVEVSFQPSWHRLHAVTVFDTLVDIVFWTDFFINLITGYIDKWGALITSKR